MSKLRPILNVYFVAVRWPSAILLSLLAHYIIRWLHSLGSPALTCAALCLVCFVTHKAYGVRYKVYGRFYSKLDSPRDHCLSVRAQAAATTTSVQVNDNDHRWKPLRTAWRSQPPPGTPKSSSGGAARADLLPLRAITHMERERTSLLFLSFVRAISTSHRDHLFGAPSPARGLPSAERRSRLQTNPTNVEADGYSNRVRQWPFSRLFVLAYHSGGNSAQIQ